MSPSQRTKSRINDNLGKISLSPHVLTSSPFSVNAQTRGRKRGSDMSAFCRSSLVTRPPTGLQKLLLLGNQRGGSGVRSGEVCPPERRRPVLPVPKRRERRSLHGRPRPFSSFWRRGFRRGWAPAPIHEKTAGESQRPV